MQSVPRLIESFRPEHYTLSLTLDRENRSFEGIVNIEGEGSGSVISLHSKDLAISNVLIDGKSATFEIGKNDQLYISQPELIAGKHIVVVGFSGKITDAMHGLYPSRYEHEDMTKELLATQFESHHAREVFPCIDEPEAKAIFDLTLTTEKGITVLGNMPVDWQREEDGLLVTKFQTSPRMSSYLLAWVTGELHKRTATTKGGVEVNVWATPAQSPESLDFALDIATRTIDFFDEYFGIAYPLPKSDHVALPDFSSGAMENWGLITYREIALLADPKTTGISSKRYIATVIAHELSHQWFGNLVTMKWWNNLWLNESFATLMEYIAIDTLHPEWDIWLEFASHESIMALRRDAIDGVQAVQVEVNHPDEISTLFDGAIVYAKGARLLRMLQHYIGHEAFQKGLKSYFKKFAYQNTAGNDLWEELSATSGKDIAGFMNTWISQPGYPVLHVSKNSLSQEQFFVGEHKPSTKIWPIPLGASSTEDIPALLETKELHIQVTDDNRFNVGDSAHFITHYAPSHLTKLIDEVKNGSLTALDRLQLLHEQTLLIRGGYQSSAELIPLLRAYASETNDNVWDIIALAFGELKKFVEDDTATEKKLRTFAGELARNEYDRLGWEMKDGEPEIDTKLRATILSMMVYSEDQAVIAKAKKLYADHTPEELDPELRALIISAVVRHSDDPVITETLLDAYQSSPSAELQLDICSGITSTKDTTLIAQLLENLSTDAVRNQDVARWFVFLIRGRDSRALAWQWVRDSWSWIEETFAGDKSYDDFPCYAAAGLTTRQQLEEYKTFFTPKMEIPALARVIELGINEVEARVELIERDREAVRKALL